MIQFVVAADRERLHHAVADWLRTHGRTRYALAWKTADLVVTDRLTDPDVSVVYLTADQLIRYRDTALGAIHREYVRAP